MKLLIGMAALLLTACANVNSSGVALRDVTVVNVIDGSLRAQQSVLITGNRITAIGPTAEIHMSGNAAVLDASGDLSLRPM